MFSSDLFTTAGPLVWYVNKNYRLSGEHGRVPLKVAIAWDPLVNI